MHMHIQKLGRWWRCILATGLLVTPLFAWAANWTTIQDVSLVANATLMQGNDVTNHNSIQALNVIKLVSGDRWTPPSNRGQAVVLSGNNLTLNQSGGGNNNVQAANVFDGYVFENNLKPRQTVAGFDHVSMQQTSSGTNNVQALNVAQLGNVIQFEQRVSGDTVTMNNLGVGASNTQTLNYYFVKDDSGNSFEIVTQTAVIQTLNIHSGSNFNSTGRYGQAVNLVVIPSRRFSNMFADWGTSIGTLNVNGNPANQVSAVINRKVSY